MDVRNCRKCRRIFNYIGGQPICPQCRETLEKKFQEVKTYIQDHRNASVAVVSQECDVDESQIHQWVREERLMFASGVNVGVVCENCGEPISTGRFCAKCKTGMINDLTQAGRQPVKQEEVKSSKDRDGNKMRFLNT